MKIETKRLLLRPFTSEDAEDLFEYLNNPCVNCFMEMKLDTIADAHAAVLERMDDPFSLYFAIVLKESGKVIGEIFAEPEATDSTDSIKDTYSPCWMLNTAYHGNGYAYEAVSAFYDLLFNEMSARRIYTYTEDYNIACQRLCERLGMRMEGLFKEFVSFINGSDGKPIYENTYQYAILKKRMENLISS